VSEPTNERYSVAADWSITAGKAVAAVQGLAAALAAVENSFNKGADTVTVYRIEAAG
jgi:hypothetical protein